MIPPGQNAFFADRPLNGRFRPHFGRSRSFGICRKLPFVLRLRAIVGNRRQGQRVLRLVCEWPQTKAPKDDNVLSGAAVLDVGVTANVRPESFRIPPILKNIF